MMTKQPSLANARILIADQDRQMVDLLWKTLHHMGMTNLARARNGREALDVLKKEEIDLLITEWNMEYLDGLALIKALRRAEDARFATLPVMMLTGRAGLHDVVASRDAGVTEFLVKPYNSKNLFSRLEYLVDHPRDFIFSPGYVGPDRRRAKPRAPGEAERRISPPALLSGSPSQISQEMKQKPHRLGAVHQLRNKMGLTRKLSEVITPQLLEEAQRQIEASRDESLAWVAEDLAALEAAFQEIVAQRSESAVRAATERALSIKSRTGMFGFELASQIAFSLYGFLTEDFSLGKMPHVLVLQKHIEVLKILLARQIIGEGGTVERELMHGLMLLRGKLAPAAA